MESMKTLNIAVTGINAVDSPGPGVPVLRSLKEASFSSKLFGFSYAALEPGNFMSQLLDNSFLFPYPNTGPIPLLDRIRQVHSLVNLDIIIPTLDSELDNYITISTELEKMGIRTFLPDRKALHTRDKSFLSESLGKEGFLIPESVVISEVSGIRHAIEKLGFPLFVKGVFYEAYLARTPEEALGYFYSLSSKWGIPVIFQKYISGEECNVCALASKGNMVGAVAMKKLFLTDKGKAWAGVTIDSKEALDLSRDILKKIDWNGGCELEFLVESKTNKMYLLEMNPRFPAWIYLATSAGQNLPEMMVKIILGENVPKKESFDVGKIFVRHSWDEIITLKELEMITVKGQMKEVQGNL